MPNNKPDASNLYQFWRGLTPDARQTFADKTGVSYRYIDIQLIHRRRNPPISTLDAMVEASQGKLTREGLIEFFNPSIPPQGKTNEAIIATN